MALSSRPHRHRSPSDPFSDPPAISYSSYGVPTLSRNAPPQHRQPPPVPPKGQSKPSSNSKSHTKQAMPAEVVQTSRTSNESARIKMNRSQTQQSAYVTTNLASRTFADMTHHASLRRSSTAKVSQTTPRRSLSQDSVLRAANNVEKGKTTTRRPPTKKGSSHADVIDRLDFSGVGPSTCPYHL